MVWLADVVLGSPLSPLLQLLGIVVMWLLWHRCSRCARRAVISSWSPGPSITSAIRWVHQLLVGAWAATAPSADQQASPLPSVVRTWGGWPHSVGWASQTARSPLQSWTARI